MNNFLAGQQIEKRRYSGSIPSHSSRKTYTGSNMGSIKQNTISGRAQKYYQPKKTASAQKINTKQKTAKRNYPAALSFSQTIKMISYPLGFIALALIVSFLTLNRDKLNNSVVNPLDDNAYQSAMAAYTGIIAPSAADIPADALVQENLNLDDDPIPLDLMETFSWKDYTIKRGDSISKIAASSSLSMDTIIALNDISNAKRIREGTVLRIPNMDGIPYTVKNGDSLSRISAKFEVPLEAILDANGIESEVLMAGTNLFIPGARMAREDLKKALGEFFLYPIKGRLTSPFGWRTDPVNGVVRRHHAAVDLAAPTGTPIKASADGIISVAGTNATFGKYVIITHSDGYNTMYAHMNKIYLNKDTKVLQGTVIGEVGSTGYSTGPHLHFGVFKNGRAINPLDFLD
ncbi:MAG: M23 family metallopeptidase [Treponema sp.]|jgi:murein DD-endopeptidase MepM/ murein hydrolase activator NlpD|nr:M23 family metallopeptidase [Treponema sp.]